MTRTRTFRQYYRPPYPLTTRSTLPPRDYASSHNRSYYNRLARQRSRLWLKIQYGLSPWEMLVDAIVVGAVVGWVVAFLF